ncbi:MAG: Gfo/Idh/MocA family oxidoreductase [Mediterranea sp.]|jgi:myo-inositol 2-dehydrogenase/D-chiro-inositol 1-dehydrogenase|nr:Gfo/Idh/MocA family oxidoreductase [Mediterranea sp.]
MKTHPFVQTKIKVAIIGFGRMGKFYWEAMRKSGQWDIAYICDVDPEARLLARQMSPESRVVDNNRPIFEDESVQVVGLFSLANFRLEHIERAIRSGKHIIAEKPIADTMEREWRAVELAERSDRISTVNLYLRNSWYHNQIKTYIRQGEIGELAILRVCHMTPGLVPGEGHEAEGPAFHDCGMHYVDIARWYAESEYKTWHAQGMRMWNYKDPWWVQCHGTFQNGVVFDITQGFVYGQLSKTQTHNSYIDIIGTKGIVRMTHDFKTAVVDLHGVSQTLNVEKPFGGKNIDTLCRLFAHSVETGRRHPQLPTFRDSAIASQYAWDFFDNSLTHDLPAIGNLDTLEQIRERRRTMQNGYGLLHHNKIEPHIIHP